MNVYNFKKIEKCYVFGNIDRNMDRFIKNLTSNISKFRKEEHPKEIERQERLKKREEEMHHIGIGGIGHLHNPFDGGHGRPMRRADRVGDDMRIAQAPTFASTWDDGRTFLKKGNNKIDSTYNDSVIIVSGNCGIGNKSKKYYDETFGKLDKILGDNNCFILFVRGNNDNPSIFNNREIDFEHIKTIPDYSVVVLKTFNCLCIGGSVSMDKEWKLAQEELYGKKLYWEDEAPQYDEDKLNEILEAYNINCVITSTCPSFAYPGTNAFKKSKWFYRDKQIINEFSNERKIMDKIYEKIMDSDSKPYMWVYGRFKMHNTSKLNDMVFISLSAYNMIQVNSQLEAFFGLDTSKKLDINAYTFDNIITDGINRASYDEHEDDVMEMGEPEMDEEEFEDFDDESREEEHERIEEEAATPIQGLNTRREALDRFDRMIQEITAVDNATLRGYADYARLYDGNNPGVYAVQNEPMAVNYGELRAITLEDINRAATLVTNRTTNG